MGSNVPVMNESTNHILNWGYGIKKYMYERNKWSLKLFGHFEGAVSRYFSQTSKH